LITSTAIKDVLRQGNLNPEIEEKLLNLQRYQEKQAKGEPFDPTAYVSNYSTRGAAATRTAGSGYDSTLDSDDYDDDSNQSFRGSKRRGLGVEDDDDEWVLDTPRKYIKKADREKMERGHKPTNYMAEVNKQINEDKAKQVIVTTTDTGHIRKNIIFCNRAEIPVQNNFVASGGESEKSPEKALLASKLKMKAAQKLTGLTEEQVKHHKLQVGFRGR
jgi:ferredoxin-NADP reductase